MFVCCPPRWVLRTAISSQRGGRSEEHTSELQSLRQLVCRLLLEKKKKRDGPMPETERTTATPRQSVIPPFLESPLHGYQGDRCQIAAAPSVPASLTIAVSREAGASEETICRRSGKELGWQVYNQEMLEYTAQEGASRHIIAHLPPVSARWAEERLEVLLRYLFFNEPATTEIYTLSLHDALPI